MRAQPLIVHTSAAYQGPADATVADLEARALSLEELDRILREKKEALRRDDGVHEAEVLAGLPLWQALYDLDSGIPLELQAIISGILDRTQTVKGQELDENPPIAQTGLWQTEEAFIDNEAEWLDFRRRTIAECGVTTKTFCQQVPIIFPSIILSSEFPDCLDTLDGGFDAFLPIIVCALTALEKCLLTSLGALPIVDGLKQFTAASGFETTMEGRAERNDALTFTFKTGEKQQSLVCAPHMKLATSAIPGDSAHYHNRIYFNPHQAAIGTVQIHVGHIGKHL